MHGGYEDARHVLVKDGTPSLGDTAMSVDLLQKWLAYYDPIHRGYTVRGIANALTATNGWCFPRVAGGYNLYRGRDGIEPIDFAQSVGAAGPLSISIANFAWRPHAASTRYVYVIKAIGGGGVESEATYPARVAEFDAEMALLGPRPNGPSELTARAAAGGRFELRWVYPLRHQEAAPSAFHVHHDGGTGLIDYGTVVASAPYRHGRIHYHWLSGPFGHGARRIWGVRAVTAEGVDDGNTLTAAGLADAEAPPAHPDVAAWALAEV